MKALRHTGIVVRDLKKMQRFYQDILGLKLIKKMHESGDYIDTICALKDTRLTTVKLKAGNNGLIELLCFHSHPSLTKGKRHLYDIGISHIALTVGDIAKEYRRLKKAGIRFNSKAQISSDGRAKVMFLRDPEGNLIEMVEVLNRK